MTKREHLITHTFHVRAFIINLKKKYKKEIMSFTSYCNVYVSMYTYNIYIKFTATSIARK